MVAIVVHAFKTLLKFVDFEKKVDYYFILLMNIFIVGICFMIPVFIDYLLLLKIKDEFLSIILSITTYALLFVYYLMCILLIKKSLNFFIVFIDKDKRYFIKRSFNRNYYEEMIRLDTVRDIEKQINSQDVDYPLRRLYKSLHYRYYNHHGEKFEEIASIFNKFFYKRFIFSKEHKKKKIAWLILSVFTIVLTLLYSIISNITFLNDSSAAMLNLIIYNIYYFLSFGILSMIIDSIDKKNNRAKILLLNYFSKKDKKC